MGCDESLGSKTYKTVSGVVAYTDPTTGRTLHLIINQAIHIPHLDHHLLCPMQCRVNDVIVDETPKFLASRPTDQTHALTVADPDDPSQMTVADPDDPSQTLTMPLSLRGVTSLLYVRNVTAEDFYNTDTPRIDLTLETLTWDPTTNLYEEQEEGMLDYSGNIARDAAVRGPNLVINVLHSLTTDTADITHDCNFHQVLQSLVTISSMDTCLTGNLQSRKTAPIDFATLANRWMISTARGTNVFQPDAHTTIPD
jgi:hypothetical protein